MSEQSLSRRQFIEQSVRGVGLCALGLGGALLAKTVASAQAAGDPGSNPFAYDIGRVARTDPRLVTYEQVATFADLGADPRRIAVGGNDRIYIATKSGVNSFDLNGTKLSEIPTSSPARAVAVAGDETVYVSVRTHIEVFNSK